jgi:cyanophycinase
VRSIAKYNRELRIYFLQHVPKSLILSLFIVEVIMSGKFFLIGGGPAVREPGEAIMERFIAESGGAHTKLTIITAASDEPEEVNGCYWEIFTGLGVSQIFSPKILHREDAQSDWVANQVAESTAVFIAGGSQANLLERLSGTAVERAICEVWRRGGVLAGTSSGASIFGALMILDGGTGNKHLRQDMIEIGPGFGLIDNTAIDTHCSSRGRIPRIVSLLITYPSIQAIGIDEDTALFVEDGIGEVLGHNAVYLLDRRTSSEVQSDANTGVIHMCASGITLHCLTRGHHYNLARKQPESCALSSMALTFV